jgi:uncharacterized protein YcfJ
LALDTKEDSMTNIAKTLFATSALAFAAAASAQVTFYENEAFQGRSVTNTQRLNTFDRVNDNRASSVIVVGQRWQVCEDASFNGRCTVLRPGQYPSLTAMGLNDRISSARPLSADRHVNEADYAPMPVVAKDYRRGRDERLFDADVTSAKAVVGTPAQRCWMEREQVSQQAAQPAPQAAGYNLPGAAIGAVLGGILGHQVGGGTGKQIATVGGAVGGAALGAQYGRGTPVTQAAVAPPVTADVRRCDNNAAQATPSYWDVTYQFRGLEHRVQMAAQPGKTITVNRQGEPRA